MTVRARGAENPVALLPSQSDCEPGGPRPQTGAAVTACAHRRRGEKAPSVGVRTAWCTICSRWTAWHLVSGYVLWCCESCSIGQFVPRWWCFCVDCVCERAAMVAAEPRKGGEG